MSLLTSIGSPQRYSDLNGPFDNSPARVSQPCRAMPTATRPIRPKSPARCGERGERGRMRAWSTWRIPKLLEGAGTWLAPHEDGLRDRQPGRLRGLEADHRLELNGLLAMG